jgi:ADP-ribose pyrophosphatase YjhB (NUDIX family)
VGGIVFVDGRVLLIKRRFEPLAGRWSLPGGALEVGETLAEGLAREMKEETGLDVEVGPVVDVFDRITRDAQGRPRFHYVLVDFLCTARAGTPIAGSDVAEVALVDTGDLARYDLTPKTIEVVGRARALAGAS